MPTFQPLLPFLRPFAAPRASTCRQFLSFSTASRLCVDQPPNPVDAVKVPQPATPEAPSTPQEPARAADLAAAEARTDADSAQPVAPKPILPSDHTNTPSSAPQAEAKAPKPFPKTKAKSPKAAATSPVELTPTSPKSSPPASTPEPSGPQSITLSLPPARYHVARSHNKNYPVYTDYKRGGNLHLTTVRKITGEAAALRDELRIFLNKKEGDVNINNVTGHVVVKGFHKGEIVKYLQARGM
ncbi:hypothetical protein P154DRAFT_619702 [Amniculicola lignicola CBS 123094]|uniref:Large ribosomal subunit protein mL49 n=1 Tax=Amniculicola lignicola CBS 123094 TaxID=1392246 RepID=A0A6A5WJG9_9PLEO|nr:hypothetical protein P154DRAFT_619702 [Amniculicola lignicola CBS 123094]